MSHPISYPLPVRDPRKELQAKLDSAPAEHAEALLSMYELLQQLHDQGVLDILRGVVGAKNDLLRIAVDATESPEAGRGLRNLLVLTKALGSVDPELLKGLVQSVPEALEHMKAEPPVPSMLGLIRHFGRRDLRRGVVFVNSMLEAMGRNLVKRDAPAK